MSHASVNHELPSWGDALTARLYESFNQRHDRYRAANAALAENARLSPGLRVLDIAAGSGRTAEAALAHLGAEDTVLCVEPSAPMRAAGQRRLTDPRVRWSEEWPPAEESFDRILCGAAIWQLLPLETTIDRFLERTTPGGALSFNVPAAYLGEPDEPGGGRDPFLVELPAQFAESPVSAGESRFRLTGLDVRALLEKRGLRLHEWSFRARLTQAAYRDWLKIPVIGNGPLGHIHPEARIALLDRAYERVDADSWRWETWCGWTAWKTGATHPR